MTNESNVEIPSYHFQNANLKHEHPCLQCLSVHMVIGFSLLLAFLCVAFCLFIGFPPPLGWSLES